jgi:iron complex outermembrane receptor protein
MKRTVGRSAVAMMVGFILHGGELAAQAAAPADAAAISVSIPEQPLRDALNGLARQTGLQVIYAAEDVTAGITAPPLEGRFTLADALSALLKGSGLKFEFLNPRTVAISAIGATRISVVDAGTGPAAGGAALEEVVVKGTVVFKQNDAFGATKLGLSLKGTPQTVTVVTADMIEFSSMKTFGDFYKVDASGGTAHAHDGWPRNYYRGFWQQGNNAIRVDGFRMPGDIDLDLATFDRFEVIKGPTSTLYGQNSIGGTLNAVSKLPQTRRAARLSAEAAEFSDFRVDADLTGPVLDSDVWTFRLVGAYRDADTFYDFGSEGLKLIAPSLRYQHTDATSVLLKVTYQEQDRRYHWAPALQLAGNGTGDVLTRVLSEGLVIPDVPRSRFFGMPWNRSLREATFVQLQAEHRFSNDWTLRLHGQRNSVKGRFNSFAAYGPFDEDGFAYFTSAYGGDPKDDIYGAEMNIFGDVSAFGREHTVFFGVDSSRLGRAQRLGLGGAGLSFGFPGSSFNVFDPDYSAVPIRSSIHDYAYFSDVDVDDELFGATVQLIAHPTDRLSVLLGGRYSKDSTQLRGRFGLVGTEEEMDSVPFVTRYDLDFEELVTQVGATYELTDDVNLYASYGETFDPKIGRIWVSDEDPIGRLIDPEEGTNYEIGLKADLHEDLAFSLAVFDMERTNIAQADPAHPGFSVALGTQTSRGVELGLQGRVLPQLSVYASAAYLDAEFSSGEFAGLRPANAPEWGLSVFASYEILSGALRGLGFGLGDVYKSGRESFDEGWTSAAGRPVTFDFGAFNEVDGRVFYNRGRWSFSLSGTNLLNEKYYSPAFNELYYAVHVNPPRTLRARVSVEF